MAVALEDTPSSPSLEEKPAVSLARLAEIGVGEGEGYVPRVTEADILTALQEEALLDMIYQSYVLENNCEKIDHTEVKQFAIKMQLDEDLCAELGAIPLSDDDILDCTCLEEACWIPEDGWIDDMCAAFKQASEMSQLTERTRTATVAELPAPRAKAVARAAASAKASKAKGKVAKKKPK